MNPGDGRPWIGDPDRTAGAVHAALKAALEGARPVKADGLRMDRKLVRLLPSDATAHYNLACSLALVKRKAEALRSLRQAVELGYRDFDWMQQDPDLEGLKNHPLFLALLEHSKPQS